MLNINFNYLYAPWPSLEMDMLRFINIVIIVIIIPLSQVSSLVMMSRGEWDLEVFGVELNQVWNKSISKNI